MGGNKTVLVKGLSYKNGVKYLKHSRGVDLVRALEAAGNKVGVEDHLFTAKELSEAGFSPKQELNLGNVQDWVVLDRGKALNPSNCGKRSK